VTNCLGWRPFYDEDGRYHRHDPNRRRAHYSCSHGHHFVIKSRPSCPCEGCNFGGEHEVEEVEVTP
jgi:hypothetical protein